MLYDDNVLLEAPILQTKYMFIVTDVHIWKQHICCVKLSLTAHQTHMVNKMLTCGDFRKHTQLTQLPLASSHLCSAVPKLSSAQAQNKNYPLLLTSNRPSLFFILILDVAQLYPGSP